MYFESAQKTKKCWHGKLSATGSYKSYSKSRLALECSMARLASDVPVSALAFLPYSSGNIASSNAGDPFSASLHRGNNT
jgi:hypothetical protein